MLFIPVTELQFLTSRSRGPGGQNVNKVETRVTVKFDFMCSGVLSEVQKRRLKKHPLIRNRLDREGNIVLSSQIHRTQGANKQEVVKRLRELITECCVAPTIRRPTRPSKASRARRTDAKRLRGALKGLRRKVTKDQ